MSNTAACLRLALAGAWCMGSTLANAAPELSDFTESVSRSIAATCLSVQYDRGREAYRDCVRTEARLHEAGERVATEGLEFDERIIAEQACRQRDSETDAQIDCLRNQARAVSGAQAALLADLNPDERRMARMHCMGSAAGNSIAGYRRCLQEQVDTVASLERPSLALLAVAERNQLQARCTEESDDIPAYRSCLLAVAGPLDAGSAAGGGSDTGSGTASTPDAPIDEGSTVAAADGQTDSVADGRAAGAGGDTGSTNASSIEEGSDQPADGGPPSDSAAGDGGWTDGIVDAIGSMGEMARNAREQMTRVGITDIMLAAALGVLAVLVLLWRVVVARRRNRHRATTAAPDIRGHTTFDDDTALFDSIDEFVGRDEPSEAVATRQVEPTTVPIPRGTVAAGASRQPPREVVDSYESVDTEAVTRLASGPWLDDAPLERPFDDGRTAVSSAGSASEFGNWLTEQADEQRLSFCLEFLIYWTAYADGRYPAALKRRLFRARQLDDQDLIKRWVLQEDVEAFADAVLWMRQHTTRLEREQTLDLLMAVLIQEHSITPVQVSLLRLLSDGFGIGAEPLEVNFRQAFGEELPPLPRPDRQSWWDQQDPRHVANWLAGQRSTSMDAERCRQLLGLPEQYREVDVIKAYRRAARRCHPDRFSELGPRARTMAVRQFDRFEEARDRLLGVQV